MQARRPGSDRDVYVLEGRLDSVTTQRSYFDVVTGLLRRELTTTATLLLPLALFRLPATGR